MSGRDPRQSSRLADRATTEYQRIQQQQQVAEQRRRRLAEELQVEENQLTVQDRQDETRVVPNDEARQQVSERVANQSEFLQPGDIDVDVRDDGSINVAPSTAGRRRAAARQLESIGVENVDLGEIEATGEGIEFSDSLESRADAERIGNIREQLPDQQDIFFPRGNFAAETIAFETANVVRDGDLSASADLVRDLGLETNPSANVSPVEIIEQTDPERAADFFDNLDAEEIREAQETIDERRELFSEDPSEFLDSIESERFADPIFAVERARSRATARRVEANNRADEIAQQIAGRNESLDVDDVEVDVNPATGAVESGLSEQGQQQLGVDEGFESPVGIDSRLDTVRQLDEQTQSNVGLGDVDFSESDSGEFAAELDTAARTREIETQRQQAASSLDVNPGDLTLDEQNNQFELTEEARRRREEERLDDLEADLLADLDSQTPGVDLDESDVDFSETDEGIEATLTDEAAAEVQQEQNSLLSDLDAGDTQPAAQNQQEFVGQATRPGIGIEDPLEDGQPPGFAVGDTQLLGPGEDFPDSAADIAELEPGTDEILSTDLPVLRRDIEAAVSATSQDILGLNIQRDIGRDFSVGVTDEIAERTGIEGDVDIETDTDGGSGGSSAAAAGGGLAAAATVGVAAPEPVSTGTGVAILGGLGVAGAIGLSQQSEIDAPTDPNVDQSELDVDDPRATAGELGIGSARRDASELSATGDLGAGGELDAPTPQDDLGNPAEQPVQAGELVQPQETFRDEELIILDEEIDGGSNLTLRLILNQVPRFTNQTQISDTEYMLVQFMQQ